MEVVKYMVIKRNNIKKKTIILPKKIQMKMKVKEILKMESQVKS